MISPWVQVPQLRVALVEQRVEVLALAVVRIGVAGEVGEAVGEFGVQGSAGKL